MTEMVGEAAPVGGAPPGALRWKIAYLLCGPVATLVLVLIFLVIDGRDLPGFFPAHIAVAVKHVATADAGVNVADKQEGCTYCVGGKITAAGEPLKKGHATITGRGEQGTPFYAQVYAFTGGDLPESCLQCQMNDEKLASVSISVVAPSDELPDWARTTTSATCEQFALADEEARCHIINGAVEITIRESMMMVREHLPFTRWGLALGVGVFLSGLLAAVFGRARLGAMADIAVEICVMLFALLMLAIIASGFAYVLMQDFTGGRVIQTSLGYLTRGSFQASIAGDWVFSLTLPTLRAENGTYLIDGFGAPLWAILIATVGACIIAFQFLIRSAETVAAPGAEARAQPYEAVFKDRADQLLAIAFAPVGAIFVYQSLVALDITGYVLVGTILLASGLSASALVRVASRQVGAIIERATAAANLDRADKPDADALERPDPGPARPSE